MKLIKTSLIIALVISAFSWFYISRSGHNDEKSARSVNKTVSLTPAVTETPSVTVSQPVKLVISKLGVNANIEMVGTGEDGRMGIPSNDNNVALWKFGPKPGMQGNAVIAGHYDKKNGGPAVFYKLRDLVKGDEIKVIDEKGNKKIFRVTKVSSYKDEDFPLQVIFGPSDNPDLNLITCNGEWDKVNKNYSDRLVVFSTSE